MTIWTAVNVNKTMDKITNKFVQVQYGFLAPL